MRACLACTGFIPQHPLFTLKGRLTQGPGHKGAWPWWLLGAGDIRACPFCGKVAARVELTDEPVRVAHPFSVCVSRLSLFCPPSFLSSPVSLTVSCYPGWITPQTATVHLAPQRGVAVNWAQEVAASKRRNPTPRSRGVRRNETYTRREAARSLGDTRDRGGIIVRGDACGPSECGEPGRHPCYRTRTRHRTACSRASATQTGEKDARGQCDTFE